VTLLVTGTEWENFFALRCHPDAQPEMRRIAEMMRDAMAESKPRLLRAGEWHLPLCDNDFIPDPRDWATLCLFSTARCARVSMTKHGERRSAKDEIAMAEKLIKAGHLSPTEHQAQALPDARQCANYRGWLPFRKTIPNEDNFARLTNANG
jgi:thymidylate synthase ThyX